MRAKVTEQDVYGGGYPPHQASSFGRSSLSALPYPDVGQNTRASFQDTSSYRAVTPNEVVQQPISGIPVRRLQDDGGVPASAIQNGSDEVDRLRRMLSQVTSELGKQVSAAHNDSRGGDAARAEWLQKLVLQMEAKQVLSDSELRDMKSKFSGLQHKLSGQEAENDALRENLSRANRGQPQSDAAPPEEHTRMMMAMKRENQAYRLQIEDLTQRNEILQRSVQHFEKQQQNMLSESGSLVLRLQGSEQRTDQLMKQKSAWDDELHNLRSQLVAQQKQMNKSEQDYKDQINTLQQQRVQESQRAGEELKGLHMQLALQQEQFEKQRTLMAQQRDGVQKGFEEELNDAMDKQTRSEFKIQELEAKVSQVKEEHHLAGPSKKVHFSGHELTESQMWQLTDEHADDVIRREAAFVEGIREAQDKLRAAEAEKQALESQLHEIHNRLHDTSATVVSLDSALASKAKELDAALAESGNYESRWGLCMNAARANSSKSRAFRRWAGYTMHKKVSMQIIHTAFTSTSTYWFRR